MTCGLPANVQINVPTCHTEFQRATGCANFSSWHANMPSFQTFFLRNTDKYFYTLLLCKKNSTFYLLS